MRRLCLVLVVLVSTVAVMADVPPIAEAQAPPESTADWAQISSGYYHTCAVKVTGQLWCWGQNTRGQLGTGGTSPSAVPVQVGVATDWKAVSAGSAWWAPASTTASTTPGRPW